MGVPLRKLLNGLVYLAISTMILPTQGGCGECSDAGTAETEVKYLCDCCHGPGCSGLPGKRKESKWSGCAPDAESALGQALGELEDKHPGGPNACFNCRVKGGEGTGTRIMWPDDTADTSSE